MAGWLTPYYAYALFVQLSVAIVLVTSAARSQRFPRGILAALFVCNALVTATLFLRLTTAVGAGLLREVQVFDAPTAFLILAYVAARSDALWGRRVAVGILALAGLEFVLHQPWVGIPGLSDPPPPWLNLVQQHILGGLFHLSILVAVVVLARGSRPERWVALALAPRFLFWAMHTLDEIGYVDATRRLFTSGVSELAFVWAVGDIVLLYGLPFVLGGLVWSLRGPDAPPALIVITAVAIAFLTALVSMNEEWRTVWFGVMANMITLVFIRSFFVVAGLAPDRLAVVFTRPLLPAALFSFIWLLHDSGAVVMGQDEAALVMAAVLGLAAFALLEHFWPRLTGSRSPGTGAAASAPGAAATPAGPIGTDAPDPQWTRLLVALEGSLDDGRLPSPAWTQQGLADATGISVKRVSDLPKQLNDRAEQRLDQWVPEWRAQHNDGVPLLVTKHRGVVEGVAGPRVYYRLTPWGERLRARVVAANGSPSGAPAAPAPAGSARAAGPA